MNDYSWQLGYSQYHHAVAGGSDRVATHPLPRGGTDLLQAEC